MGYASLLLTDTAIPSVSITYFESFRLTLCYLTNDVGLQDLIE